VVWVQEPAGAPAPLGVGRLPRRRLPHACGRLARRRPDIRGDRELAHGALGRAWRSVSCCGPGTAVAASAPRRNGCWPTTCSRPRWPTASRPPPAPTTSPSSAPWSAPGSNGRVFYAVWASARRLARRPALLTPSRRCRSCRIHELWITTKAPCVGARRHTRLRWPDAFIGSDAQHCVVDSAHEVAGSRPVRPRGVTVSPPG
jgi:hypothetical protein